MVPRLGKGILYFYPPKDLDLSHAVVEIVRLRELLEFSRNARQTGEIRAVSRPGVPGIPPAPFMDNREPLLRSDWTIYRGGAVFYQGTEDCALEDSLPRPARRQRGVRQRVQPAPSPSADAISRWLAPTGSPSSATRRRSAALFLNTANANPSIKSTKRPVPGRRTTPPTAWSRTA